MAINDVYGNTLGSAVAGNTVYEYDYFSGCQVNIMIGEVLIDAALRVTFQRHQTRTPVFGYASQYYSFLADGHVIIQGDLSVYFKEAGYLFYTLQRYHNKDIFIQKAVEGGVDNLSQMSQSPRYSVSSDGNVINNTPGHPGTLLEASNAARRKQVMGQNVEQMFSRDQDSDPGIDAKGLNNFWRDLGALDDNSFEDWAETLEDSIWYGSESSNPLLREKLYSKNFSPYQVNISREEVLSHRNIDQYPPVDIWIVYGDMSRHPANHTVRKLMDVSFLGTSQIIEPSGEPIQEVYPFICRNVV